jgi:predicted transcriptional regulator
MIKLNHKEEEVMKVLWKLNKAFVKEIISELGNNSIPYNTVSSIVRKLESLELVGFEAFGKTHRYYPLLTKEEYRDSKMSGFVKDYFSGSPSRLLSYFVTKEKIDKKEVEQLLNSIKDKS